MCGGGASPKEDSEAGRQGSGREGGAAGEEEKGMSVHIYVYVYVDSSECMYAHINICVCMPMRAYLCSLGANSVVS